MSLIAGPRLDVAGPGLRLCKVQGDNRHQELGDLDESHTLYVRESGFLCSLITLHPSECPTLSPVVGEVRAGEKFHES